MKQSHLTAPYLNAVVASQLPHPCPVPVVEEVVVATMILYGVLDGLEAPGIEKSELQVGPFSEVGAPEPVVFLEGVVLQKKGMSSSSYGVVLSQRPPLASNEQQPRSRLCEQRTDLGEDDGHHFQSLVWCNWPEWIVEREGPGLDEGVLAEGTIILAAQ